MKNCKHRLLLPLKGFNPKMLKNRSGILLSQLPGEGIYGIFV